MKTSRCAFYYVVNLMLPAKFSQNHLSTSISHPYVNLPVTNLAPNDWFCFIFSWKIMNSSRWTGSLRHIIRHFEVLNVLLHNLPMFLIMFPCFLACLRTAAYISAASTFVCQEICLRWLIIGGFYYILKRCVIFMSWLLSKWVQPGSTVPWSP